MSVNVTIGRKTVAHRYSITFPRVMDAGRPDWPMRVLERLGQMEGVTAFTAYDPTQAWATDPVTSLLNTVVPRRESRVRVLTLDTEVDTQKADALLHDEIIKLVAELLRHDTLGTRATVTRWEVDVEVVTVTA